jgi:hypothetical protein
MKKSFDQVEGILEKQVEKQVEKQAIHQNHLTEGAIRVMDLMDGLLYLSLRISDFWTGEILRLLLNKACE